MIKQLVLGALLLKVIHGSEPERSVREGTALVERHPHGSAVVEKPEVGKIKEEHAVVHQASFSLSPNPDTHIHASVEGDVLKVSKSQEKEGKDSYSYSYQGVQITHGGDTALAEKVMKGVLGEDVRGAKEGEVLEKVKKVVGGFKPKAVGKPKRGSKTEEVQEFSSPEVPKPSHIEEVD